MNFYYCFFSFQMDAISIFDNLNELNPAADAAASSVVTLLGAAAAIGRVMQDIDEDKDKPIMFAFLSGVSSISLSSFLKCSVRSL